MELIRNTIGQCIKERAAVCGSHNALEMNNWSCTFSQLDLITDRLMMQMNEMGISGGTHVGIWGTNTIEWIMTFLALTKLGAVPILFNTHYREDEMRDIIKYSDVEYLYYGRGNKDISYETVIENIRGDLPDVKQFISLKEEQYDFSMEELDREELLKVKELTASVNCDDTACMIFTSGTTSMPKAVMLSHYNIVNNAAAMAEQMHWNDSDRMCLVVPLFHCFGITASLIPGIMTGMTIHLVPHFRTARIWEALVARECTVLNGVPSMFMALINKSEHSRSDVSRLRSGMIAGSPVTEQDYMRICDRFYNMNLQPAYGQTETSPCISIAPLDMAQKDKAVSVGQILEHMEVRIVDINSGIILKETNSGEIQVKGYNVMKGYYNCLEETEAAFTEDGWLKTGDIGRLDKKGNLYITGRLKEIIIRSGENISPAEIEKEIRKMEGIEDVKVLGIPSPITQEEVVACVVMKEGYPFNAKNLIAFLKGRLAHYKIPEHVLKFKEFPMNASGKIHLSEIKKLAIKRVARQNKEKQKRTNKEA